MAGHSKWANIKHRKARADAQKGKVFTKLAREIVVAAREGGSDPETNFRLRMAVLKAREVNMPNDNISRAIKKGTGEIAGETFESFTYEGYGPAGVAILLEINTDNRNRTAADIRHLFSRYNGSLGESGCVGWMFARKGVIVLEKKAGFPDEDDLMLSLIEVGAEDFRQENEVFIITTAPENLEKIKELLQEEDLQFDTAEVTMLPTTEVAIKNKDETKKILKLIEALEEHDDVQEVYSNVVIDDDCGDLGA